MKKDVKSTLKKIIKQELLNQLSESLDNGGLGSIVYPASAFNVSEEEQFDSAAPTKSFTEDDLRVVEKYAKKLGELQRLWTRFANSNLSVGASKILRNAGQGNNQTMWTSSLRSANSSLFDLSTAASELAAEIRATVSPSDTSSSPESSNVNIDKLAGQPARKQAPTPAPAPSQQRRAPVQGDRNGRN